jgi:molybdopterin/thiamine biosynthesis adenylyltransferase/rhodanese-related sulfurtransferase
VPAVREADLAAGPFGARAPASLLLVLGEDAAGLAARWPATGGALLDALQGLRVEPPVGVERPTDVDVAEAAAWRDRGARLIDVREPEEQALGVPEGAETWPLSGWGSGADGVPPAADPATPVLLICASGVRSVRAAALLRERGFRDVASVRGGVAAWRAAGLPLVVPATAGLAATAVALTDDGRERYDRHLRLGAVGIEGQRRLLAATVVIVGAGGLGSPAAFYLAAAGVGRLVLIDDDRVERSNLQRQILHVDAAVGRPKVASARERLLALNPTLAIDARDCRLGPDNVEALLQGADVVIDGSDNFTARYLVDAACVRLGIPLVHGAVERFTGQVTVFDAGRQRGVAPCYRCLFPEPPGADAAPNCAEAGVLGVLPGLVGLLQATEALKLLLGIGETLVGRLLTIDALGMRVRELALTVDPACPGCGPDARFDGYAAIETVCASR